MNNEAFIDGQNLYMGTKFAKNPWIINLLKFRIYLKDKFKVSRAYYFIGYYDSKHESLYDEITNAGFILVFRKHSKKSKAIKKGNVDTDIVFEIMKKFIEREKLDKVVLVSGDGDYYKLVDYLVKKNRFLKLIAPCEGRMSSLYQDLNGKFYLYLNRPEIIKKIS